MIEWDRYIFYDGSFWNARTHKKTSELMECFYFKYTEKDIKVYKGVLFTYQYICFIIAS